MGTAAMRKGSPTGCVRKNTGRSVGTGPSALHWWPRAEAKGWCAGTGVTEGKGGETDGDATADKSVSGDGGGRGQKKKGGKKGKKGCQ